MSSHLTEAFSSSDCQSLFVVVVVVIVVVVVVFVVVAEATGLPHESSHFADLPSEMNSYCVTNGERCDRVTDDLDLVRDDLDFDLVVMEVAECDGLLTGCSNLVVEKWAHF